MRNSLEKILTIFIYVIAITALISILLGFINSEKLSDVSNYESLKQTAVNVYKNLDTGNYENLSKMCIEGKWVPYELIDIKKSYRFDGLVKKDEFIQQLTKDFGSNGWRIHFNSLEIINIEKIELEKFNELFIKESIILKSISEFPSVDKAFIVTVKGYIIGSCSIVDWEKELPFFCDKNNQWVAIVSGTPEDLEAIHREQWLTDISFNVKK